MTTVSASSPPIPSALHTTNAPKPARVPYDGKAAVAQAQAKAAAAIAAQDNSVLNRRLAELPNTVINLLQGGTGNDLVNLLFSTRANNQINNQFNNSLTQTALAAAAYKRAQVTTASSPVSDLINRLIKANTSA